MMHRSSDLNASVRGCVSVSVNVCSRMRAGLNAGLGAVSGFSLSSEAANDISMILCIGTRCPKN